MLPLTMMVNGGSLNLDEEMEANITSRNDVWAVTARPDRRKARRIVRQLWMAGLFAVASCAPGSDLPPLNNPTSRAFELGPGDQVRVITFGEQQLTGEFRVSDGGAISVPLLGPIQTTGLTPDQLASRIASELTAKKLFKDPSVSVEVIGYRPIFILGEVNKPGQYPYQPGMTMLTAVAIGGGFTYRAVTRYASDVRLTGKSAVEGRIERESLLQPGDVVTVFERTF